MTVLLAFSVAVLATGQFPVSTQVSLPGGEVAELEGDHLTYADDVLRVRGTTVLRSGPILLRADELIYEQATERATARGNVMFVAGMFTAIADEVQVDVPSLEAQVKGGLFMQKKNVTPEKLLTAKTPAELKAMGETTLTVSGTRLKKVSADEYLVDGLSFTPCDCKPTDPTWRVTAQHATVEVGDHATLDWPVVYVQQVPVLALPWLYVPLSERKTGLLVPRPNTSSISGWMLDLPYFVTLGPSYDLTFTPGYAFGASPYQANGTKGPHLATEFRYAPAENALGRALFNAAYDLLPLRDPVDPNVIAEPRQRRGLRGDFSIQHTQDLGPLWHARVDAAAVSDGYYVRDLTTDVLARQDQYIRSTATLYRRTDDTYAGLDLVTRQDLRWGYSLFETDRAADGKPLYGPNTLQRLPGLRFAVPERHLFGPLFWGGSVEYTRLGPFHGLTGDEGPDGFFDPTVTKTADGVEVRNADSGQGDRIYQTGERYARDRLDLRPHVEATFAAGPYARITPSLGWRQDLWLSEMDGHTFQRGYPIAGVTVDSELSRTFGAGNALRHTIAPEVAVRYVPKVFGTSPQQIEYDRQPRVDEVAYDEVDAAAPADGFLQATVMVRQRLLLRQSAQVKELVRLDLGQDLDLLHGEVGDSFGRLALTLDRFSFDVLGRYQLAQGRPTQVIGSVGYDDGKGAGIYARFDHLISDGSDRQRRSIDALFGVPSLLLPCREGQPANEACSGPAESLVLGGRYRFGFGLGLSYEALLQPLRKREDGEPGVGGLGYNSISQQTLGVSYGPACDCWRVEVHATFHPLATPGYNFTRPDFGFSLSIARFGSFGNGR